MATAGLRCAFAVLLVVAASLPAVADPAFTDAGASAPVVLAFAQPGGGDGGGGDPGGGCADGSCAGNLPRPGGSAGSPGSVGSGYEFEAPPADTATTAETGWFTELKKALGFGNNAEAPGRSDPGGVTDPEQEKLRHPGRPSGADGASGGAQCADGACVSSPFLPMPALIAISAVLLVLLLVVSMRLVVTGRPRRRGE
ncbi:hypothetical protein BKA01_001321 [Pseudonocardia eucalypti]|nr:hypothetical protein [Pseudonocardia eucalypti]